jgi:hypothetical protein
LTLKNVGQTPALDTYSAQLGGECGYTSFQECIEWCLQPLREEKGEHHGTMNSQYEYTEEFFHTFKTGKVQKKQRPVYFCGYFAYTDVFCIWRRLFYALSYNPATDQFSQYTLSNDEEKAKVQECGQWFMYK